VAATHVGIDKQRGTCPEQESSDDQEGDGHQLRRDPRPSARGVVSLPVRRLPLQPGLGAPPWQVGGVQPLGHHPFMPKLTANLE
jgi:hypothetical protein